MNFKHPFKNLLAGLIMMLMLVVTINFVQSRNNRAVANQESQQPELGEIQYQEDEDEEDEQEEEWEEEEEWDEEDEHGEEEGHHELREFEVNMARLEIIGRLAEVAENPTMTAGYALMQLEQFVEDEEEAVDVLIELIESDRVSPPVRNLLKMKLVEVLGWADEREEAIEVLMSMVVEDGEHFHGDHDDHDDHEDDDHDHDDHDDDEDDDHDHDDEDEDDDLKE